jgi:hypothetical protein
MARMGGGAEVSGWHLCIRIGNWMITKQGLFRFQKITAKKPMRSGKHATRWDWKKVLP